jgi:hypothetical protein
MFGEMRIRIIRCVAMGLVLGCCATARAWDVQEKVYNTTGQTAYDLTKILVGDWTVTDAIHDAFAQHAVLHFGGLFTIIHWSNGSVNNGDWTWACYNVAGYSGHVPSLVALWTDATGHFIGLAAPEVEFRATLATESSHVNVWITNNWHNWVGVGYPPQTGDGPGVPMGAVTGTNVYYAVVAQPYTLEELNDSLWDGLPPADPTWTPLTGFTLNHGDTTSPYDLGTAPAGSYILFRAVLAANGVHDTTVLQQFPREVGIPAVSTWGLAALTLLVLAAGTVVLLRRRAAAAA